MADPKRHHYLPAVYLDQFSGTDGLVSCIEKPSGYHFRTSPKNVGLRKDFNTIRYPDGGIDRKTLEAFFSKFESEYPRRIVEAKSPPVESETLDFFLQFASLQRMRTPRSREGLVVIVQFLIKRGFFHYFKSTFTDEENQLLDAAHAGDKEALAQIALRISGHLGMATAGQLDQMSFVFLKTDGRKPLITSDDPVVIFGIEGDSKNMRATLPFPSVRMVLLFPISQDTLMFEDTDLRTGLGFIKYNRKASLDVSLVRRINILMTIGAAERVFSPFERNPFIVRSALLKSISSPTDGLQVFQKNYGPSLVNIIKRLHQILRTV